MDSSVIIEIIISLVLAYLIGAIPWAFILVKLVKKTDIREIGSRNVGATNAFRAGGATVGFLVGFLDVLKGAIPTYVVLRLFGANWALLAALFAILGHSFTPYLGFRGGKGVATSLGAFAVLVPEAVGLGVAVWLVVLFLFRFVSLASIIGVISAAVYVSVTPHIILIKAILGIAVVIIILRHRSNIKKLIGGKEPRATFKRN